MRCGDILGISDVHEGPEEQVGEARTHTFLGDFVSPRLSLAKIVVILTDYQHGHEPSIRLRERNGHGLGEIKHDCTVEGGFVRTDNGLVLGRDGIAQMRDFTELQVESLDLCPDHVIGFGAHLVSSWCETR